MGNTFVITPRTTSQEISNYFGARHIPAKPKVEKLKLIVRMAQRADAEAGAHYLFPRGMAAMNECEHFCHLFDLGYNVLATSLRLTRRGGSWAWPSDLERELNEARHRRNSLSGHCMT
jgi:hypothetical protein